MIFSLVYLLCHAGGIGGSTAVAEGQEAEETQVEDRGRGRGEEKVVVLDWRQDHLPSSGLCLGGSNHMVRVRTSINHEQFIDNDWLSDLCFK